MTAAGRLGRLAALLLLLPALARGWDWSTNVESTFDCKTHRNPIQLYKEELFKCHTVELPCADGRAYFGAVREPVPRADVRACAATDYYPSDADADDVQDLLL